MYEYIVRCRLYLIYMQLLIVAISHVSEHISSTKLDIEIFPMVLHKQAKPAPVLWYGWVVTHITDSGMNLLILVLL